MKYYELSEQGRSNNLKIRSVIYDRARHWEFSKSVARGLPCKDIDYAGLDYLGGKKPRFEDMISHPCGGYLLSEKICDIIRPFLASPDDVEWLYIPQREDLEKPCPCTGKYLHFNVLRQIKPEDCFEMEFAEHVRLAQPYIKDLRFRPEAVEGLHVFMINFQYPNFFVSEEVMKAARKQKSYLFTKEEFDDYLKAMKSLYNGDIPYKPGMSFKEMPVLKKD